MSRTYKRISARGSIGIPSALRREMGIEPKDPMEIEVTEDNRITITPYQPRCVFCGVTEKVGLFRNRGICSACRDKLKEEN